MKWKKCILIHSEISGTDRLHNDIKTDIEVQTVFGRFTPLNETDLVLEVRVLTKNSRKLLIRKPLSFINLCEKVSIDNSVYNIREKTELGRFSLFYIEKLGVD